MPERILVVDDEESIIRLVSFNLRREGYTVIEARDGNEAVSAVDAASPDLVLLDVMLPGMNGLDVFRYVRSRGKTTPVIFLTAKDSEVDRVLGLELGADDYVTKPFSPRELVARVRAVLRRSAQAATGGVITYGDLRIDTEARTAEVAGRPISLTAKEFDLLSFLARNPGKVFTRETLLDRIWGYDYAGDTRIVDVHVSHVRDKTEEDPRNPKFIRTVRGIGYKFGEKNR